MKGVVALLILVLFVSLLLHKSRQPTTSPTTPHTTTPTPPFPIDIVYTWAGENHTTNRRLANNDELRFSIRSVMTHAPWVNRIHILMNNKKTPSWFNSRYSDKISLWDHHDTFPLEYKTPYTNSNAIETTLHNIPTLAEHFIYFNDDVMLGRPTEYTDFFTSSGKAVVSKTVLNNETILTGEDKLKIDYPVFVKRFYPHVPVPLIRSEISAFHKKYPDYIRWIRTQRGRTGRGCDVCTKHNLKCPCAQQQHLITRFMYDRKRAELQTFNKSNYFYLNSNNVSKRKDTLNRLSSNPIKYICLNDTTSDPHKKQQIRVIDQEFYKSFYPNIPFFETS